ncbi:MAG: sel1 repeat family protein [Tannerellaceae bacterium]|jgi:TPR repeat protein|nr:sel1 repeat family protein [Tannerellaceae bacterium]
MEKKSSDNFFNALFTSSNNLNMNAIQTQQHFIARRYAADHGDTNSQALLAFFYALGRKPVKKNTTEAVKWARRAAENGSEIAQALLGVYYMNGEGVPKNPRKSIEWMTKAAEQGNTVAEYYLGCFYEDGTGVEINLPLAYKWYLKAAQKNHLDAIQRIAHFHFLGLGNIPENRPESVRWYRRAAEGGHKIAQYFMGVFHRNEKDGEYDLDKSVEWLTMSAEQGYTKAQFELGSTYLFELRDCEKAMYWFRKAAKNDDAMSLYYLSRLYVNDEFFPHDYDTALYWCERLLPHRGELVKNGIADEPLLEIMETMRQDGFSASRARL